MTLTPGTRLGPYEVTAAVGAGGMGEVYRARDSRLGRDVAVKVLPSSLSGDPERLARFEQEARAASALNHPNILTVYDIGSDGGAPYIVTELLEGAELSAILREGALPVRKALDYAQQIASGLSAAHDRGIVHRDLKPGNLFVMPDGRVKILDFGLAKLRPGRAEPAGSELETRKALTEPGVVMGTVGYMSPEQVRGKDADHRADIFSLGVILREMLTGKRTFTGESSVEVMNAVLKEDPPDIGQTNPNVSPQIDRLVRRCIEKQPEARFHSAHDLGFAIEALSAPSTSGARPGLPEAAPTARSQSSRVAWGLVIALALTAAALAWLGRTGGSARTAPPVILTLELPDTVTFAAAQTDSIRISPDGRLLVFTGQSQEGVRQLWIRPMDSLDARPLAGTENPIEPFWSPDSRHVGFGAQGKLKRVEVSGGTPRVLCDAARLVGGTWNQEGVILFSPDFNRGLYRVSAEGGAPAAVTEPDRTRQENSHSSPEFLPDGRSFLFLGGPTASREIMVGSLDSKALKVLARGIRAVYTPPGFLVYAGDAGISAQAFDLESLSFRGDPVPLLALEGPVQAGGANQGIILSASSTGTLVVQRSFAPEAQLHWFDRRGNRLSAIGPRIRLAVTAAARISPDGRSVAIQNRESRDETRGIWTIDIARNVSVRLTTIAGQYPVWSPDSRRVAWLMGFGRLGIWARSSNGLGEPELLLEAGAAAGGNTFPADWSADGRYLLYTTRGERTRVDIWALPLGTAEGKPQPVVASEFDDMHGQLSPDGRWLAYRSDVSGSYEVYVQSLTEDMKIGDQRYRISADGGSQPRFRRDGREMFYLSKRGGLMSVPITTTAAKFTFGTPVLLFTPKTLPLGADPTYEFDVTRDGQRFLIGTILDGPHAKPPSPIVFFGWTQAVSAAGAAPSGEPAR